MDSYTNDEEIIHNINEAIKNHELKAYYQPQYDSLTGKLLSAEALVRWIKPDGSVIMPGKYIPVLEKSDAILALDWYILNEVCRFIKYQEENNIPKVIISVNFSRMHMEYEPDFTEKLCKAVDSFGIKHKWIEAEITESALAEHPERTEALIKELRDKGFAVAVDDFGSGLSSLSFVKDIEFDTLKIDKSLISHNCEDEKERILLECIFEFANRLNLNTVAEGVETREQLGFMRTCSCKKIQGFLFAKPMTDNAFAEVCRTQTNVDSAEDILMVQAPSSATNLLLNAIFTRYPLVIFSNLTRNSFYMMAYENFSSTSCPSTGVFEELIAHGASTMHPEDSEVFAKTFSIENQMNAYERGEKTVRLITRQLGDDGIYRRVETTNYFVKNPSSDDVLVISLCDNLE